MYTVHTSCVSACVQAHTQTHKKKEKVHYNETVDGRPLCRDPNSCSALGGRGKGIEGERDRETDSKQY